MRHPTSQFDVPKIEAEIQWLQAARRSCTDSGVQKQIDIWIEARQKLLRRISRKAPKFFAKGA